MLSEIYYFQGNGECDFVTTQRGIISELYQVCLEINNLNREREVNGLFEAMIYFNKQTAYIITKNQTDTFKTDNLTIKAIPAWKWMSENN